LLQKSTTNRAVAPATSAANSSDRLHSVFASDPRNGRHGLAFTRNGAINIKNAHHADDPRPLDAESRCPAARDFSRAYLHHLFRAGEALGGTLLSIVNLYYYQDLMAGARAAIAAGRFADFLGQTCEQWAAKGDRRES
jgi:queuine tRNA-ribosyltransferase